MNFYWFSAYWNLIGLANKQTNFKIFRKRITLSFRKGNKPRDRRRSRSFDWVRFYGDPAPSWWYGAILVINCGLNLIRDNVSSFLSLFCWKKWKMFFRSAGDRHKRQSLNRPLRNEEQQDSTLLDPLFSSQNLCSDSPD